MVPWAMEDGDQARLEPMGQIVRIRRKITLYASMMTEEDDVMIS